MVSQQQRDGDYGGGGYGKLTKGRGRLRGEDWYGNNKER